MDVEDSYDILFQKWTPESSMSILSRARKCLSESSSEREILRALEIAFNFCLNAFAGMEDEFFQNACFTSKKIIEDQLKNIEKNPKTCVEGLTISLQILSLFKKAFEILNENQNVSLIQVKNLLIVTSEVVFCCLSHCKISEQVYGPFLASLAEHLSNFFKKCCDVLEHLLNFLTRINTCGFDEEDEIMLLDKVMTYLSKSGFVLINLEIKTMAKVWKAFALLIEYHLCLRDNYKIDNTFRDLCSEITTNMEAILCEGNEDFEKIIKLNCFLLKVIIKLCTLYNEGLKSCHDSLLNLLLMLCRWDTFVKTQPKFKVKGLVDLLNQLTIGTDPLLSVLLKEEKFVREFHKVGKNHQSVEFPVLCCLIMKKLIDCNFMVRNLWFNKKENILMWIFSAASSSKFVTTSLSLPNIIISGKQKKFTDLYEYVLVTTSAFLMTATADEYNIIESMLVRNILQTNPIKALLATDIWCLLARFAGSELCFSQILSLSITLQGIETERVEKWYLTSLIQRLFPLLSETHKELFLKNFPDSFYSNLWEGCCFDGLSPKESSHIRECVLSQLDNALHGSKVISKSEKCEMRIIKLWKFNCEILISTAESKRFLKILCGVTASVVSNLPPEDLFLVLSQIKKLLTMGQPTCIQLYFAQFLKSLSTVFIPPGNFQRKIMIAIADIFRVLLSSKQVLAKQKAFETFYIFSHITSHGEVISHSVQDAPEVKMEVTNYFKKTLPDRTDFNLSDYFSELYGLKFKHVCSEVGIDYRKVKLGPGDLKTIVSRWKEDGKQIVDCFQLLSESEKIQIKNVCQSILYLPVNQV